VQVHDLISDERMPGPGTRLSKICWIDIPVPQRNNLRRSGASIRLGYMVVLAVSGMAAAALVGASCTALLLRPAYSDQKLVISQGSIGRVARSVATVSLEFVCWL
jgi:hypothetical protein